MRPFTSTISFDQALRTLREAAIPIDRTDRVALSDADGRVCASDVISAVDVPPFDRAAMDGYAVIAADTIGASEATPRELTCVDRIYTGHIPERGVGRGECIEIATGAPMPPGADAVVMVEQTTREGDTVRFLAPTIAGRNIGRRGADIRAGHGVIRQGDVFGPARIGAAAAVGATSVEVFARPSVAILSTGTEITAPGGDLRAGQLYDVNRFTVEAVVRRHGGVAHGLPPVSDHLDELLTALDAAAAHDVVVFSGGSSVGDRDLMLDVVRQRGEVIFHGVALKPGKPVLFGRVGRTPVFGLPGYPASCLATAYVLLVPFLRATARLPPWRPRIVTLPLARRIASAPGRHQFYTVRVIEGRAEPAFKTSGDITSMADADGYIEIPADADTVEAGAEVKIILFD